MQTKEQRISILKSEIASLHLKLAIVRTRDHSLIECTQIELLIARCESKIRIIKRYKNT